MSLNPSQKDNTFRMESALVSRNPVYMFACTKAERLVAAVHLMTRHIGEQEVLRTSLRSESVSLLRLLHVHDERVSEDALSERIELMKSLLDAAYHTGLISEINYNVVYKEYTALDTFLREKRGVFGSTEAVVGDTFFDVPMSHSLEAPKPKQERREVEKQAPTIKDTDASKGQSSPRRPSTKKISKRVVERKNGRRGTIIELMKRKKRVSVRDVADVITGVSEKTIQRELLALVAEGLATKEGERRWSTYSLV